MSILRRTTCAPSACLPSRISRSSWVVLQQLHDVAGFAGVFERAAAGAHLLGALAVDIRETLFDEKFREAVEQVEVVAGVVQVLTAVGVPIEAQPSRNPGSCLHTPGLPSPGWCRRSACGRRRRSRARSRSSGQIDWRGRVRNRPPGLGGAGADFRRSALPRLARAAVPGLPAQVRRAYLPAARSLSIQWRMKLVTWPSPVLMGAADMFELLA